MWSLALILAAGLWPVGAAEMPAELAELEAQVRALHPGVRLVELSAVVGMDGRARCARPGASLYDGYKALFQSPAGNQWMIMACAPRRPVKAYMSAKPFLQDGFIGIEEALAALRAEGWKLVSGSTLKARLAASADGTPLWTFDSLGRDVVVDGRTGKIWAASGRSAAAAKAPEGRSKAKGRGRKAGADTARSHLRAVREYARRQSLSGDLLGLDGLADGDGSVNCTPGSDGWAYYYAGAAGMPVRVVYGCGRDVSEGRVGYIWVSGARHLPLGDDFIDSDAALAALGSLVSKRKPVTMRLANHREPPFNGHPVLWEIQQGNTSHWVDGRTGKYLGKR